MFYINTETQEYPLSIQQIKERNPNVSFPSTLTNTIYAPVTITPKPSVTVIEKAVEAAPILDNGVWIQQWNIVAKFATQAEADAAIAQEAIDNKAKALSLLSAKRYTEETKGITFNGFTVATDRESQSMLMGAYTAVQLDLNRIINWKTDTGFVQLTKNEIELLSTAVVDHIQSCFDNERALAIAIESDVDTDISVGWPE